MSAYTVFVEVFSNLPAEKHQTFDEKAKQILSSKDLADISIMETGTWRVEMWKDWSSIEEELRKLEPSISFAVYELAEDF